MGLDAQGRMKRATPWAKPSAPLPSVTALAAAFTPGSALPIATENQLRANIGRSFPASPKVAIRSGGMRRCALIQATNCPLSSPGGVTSR